MSIIDSANHNVVTYVAGTTKPFTGQRLVVVTYKTVTDKSSALYNVKRESKAVSVPVITDEEITRNIHALVPHVRNLLENTQRSIVRELLDESSVRLSSCPSISNDALSINECISYLESSDESGRLTKESVGSWFDTSIADMLSLALADKLGVSDEPTDAESRKVMDIIAVFRNNITALAGGKTSYPPSVASQLKKAIELAPSGDVIAARFMVRIDKMIAAPVVDLMNVL